MWRRFDDTTTRRPDDPSPEEAPSADGGRVRRGRDGRRAHEFSFGIRCGSRRCRRRVESSGDRLAKGAKGICAISATVDLRHLRWTQYKRVQAAFCSKPTEFGGVEIWIVKRFPQSKIFDCRTASHPVVDGKTWIFRFMFCGTTNSNGFVPKRF